MAVVRCGSCASESLTQISMTMTDGDVVDFTSCHRCEYKSWRSGGADLPLSRVLALATRRR